MADFLETLQAGDEVILRRGYQSFGVERLATVGRATKTFIHVDGYIFIRKTGLLHGLGSWGMFLEEATDENKRAIEARQGKNKTSTSNEGAMSSE